MLLSFNLFDRHFLQMCTGRKVRFSQKEKSGYYTCWVSLNGAFILCAYLLLCPLSLDTWGLIPPPLPPTPVCSLQLHLSWIISWLTPDTAMSLTGRLPTVALPNGPRPPILQVSIVEPVQAQTLV